MENHEVEQTLLGKIIVNNTVLEKYSELLHKDLFDNPFCKSVYHAITKLKEQILEGKKKIKEFGILDVNKIIDDLAVEILK